MFHSKKHVLYHVKNATGGTIKQIAEFLLKISLQMNHILTILKISSMITYHHSMRVHMKKNFLILLVMATIFATAAFASPPNKAVTQDSAVGIEASIGFSLFGNFAIAPIESPVFIGDEYFKPVMVAAFAAPDMLIGAIGNTPANYVSLIAGNLILDTNLIQTNVVAYNPRGRTQALANDQGYMTSINMLT